MLMTNTPSFATDVRERGPVRAAQKALLFRKLVSGPSLVAANVPSQASLLRNGQDAPAIMPRSDDQDPPASVLLGLFPDYR
jgi:hypothetical protein